MNKKEVYLNTKLLIENIRESYKTFKKSDETFYIGYVTALFDYKLISMKQTTELKLLIMEIKIGE
jgi:hypothetical protein